MTVSWSRRAGFVGLILILIAATGPTHAAEAPAPAATPAKNDYADPATWLCRPGLAGACAADLTTTVVHADGSLTTEPSVPAKDPAVDCFYVYPTVSNDPTPNSDMKAGLEELGVIAVQFARFGRVCRTFAPLYRQVTLTALRAALSGSPMTADRQLPYNDVLDAWKHYLAHDNGGRGVVLIGHSQGSGVLTQMIRNEIDGKPIQKQIVSALLIGTSVFVPPGKDIGGSFNEMPLCRAATQTQCIVTFASFRATSPPTEANRFVRPNELGGVSACTNPAALALGSGALHAYLLAGRSAMGSREPAPWTTSAPKITTTFVSVPGLLTSECVSGPRGSYLAVTVHGDPNDARVDDITGDVVINERVQVDWGLHLIDMNIAMGNLVELVAQQSTTYGKRS